MEERIKEIEQYALDIFKRIREKEHISPFMGLLNNEDILRQYRSIGYLKNIVVKSMQIGNYRRAIIVLLCMDQIIANMELFEEDIKQRVSLYILGE